MCHTNTILYTKKNECNWIKAFILKSTAIIYSVSKQMALTAQEHRLLKFLSVIDFICTECWGHHQVGELDLYSNSSTALQDKLKSTKKKKKKKHLSWTLINVWINVYTPCRLNLLLHRCMRLVFGFHQFASSGWNSFSFDTCRGNKSRAALGVGGGVGGHIKTYITVYLMC